MNIAVTGTTGLIGSALVPALRGGGHTVRALVRRPPRNSLEIYWDPGQGILDPTALTTVDAVVHLAGAGVGDHRWTSGYKNKILNSRVAGTTLLAAALADLDERPRVLLSASAVGWYGDTGEREVDESARPGTGFLAEVTAAWEASTAVAEHAGVRVCHLRSGVVLSTRGGALARQLPLFRLALGGRLGSGRQWLSWITLADEIAAIRFLLTADAVHGPVNLTSPEPVTNAAFTRALGAALRRPAIMPVPAVALRVALGDFADEGVLVSQRVRPRVLTEAGFTFSHPAIDAALAAAITRADGD
ncbi:TIGR01777 family oxidoreductase [Frankia sp. CiP3]|uniref:TIGR01777 family oxidoreductase n=1 Tax=Frankia sp. CiP3 TaxID=2880971 RepID=UPI001EF56D5B|nr:TIGR01777 family oxidoreductase [Frankia sp. CiP3]